MNKVIVRVLSFFLAALSMAFIFYNSSLDGTKSSKMSESASEIVAEITVPSTATEEEKKEEIVKKVEKIHAPIREIAHVAEFAIFAFFVALFVCTFDINVLLKFVITLVFGCAYAASDELHQYFVPGRACEFKDMLLDFTGVLIAAVVVCVCAEAYRRITTKRGNSDKIEEASFSV